MSQNAPIKPQRPKHVPFWPVLVAIVFMLAIVISGIVASNHARGEHLTVVTSTLPPKHAKATTTTTVVVTNSTLAVQSSAASAACLAANLITAAQASGKLDLTALGSISTTQFKCVSGYALARLTPQNPSAQPFTADFQLQADNTWKLLNKDQVNPLADGIPASIAAQLVLS